MNTSFSGSESSRPSTSADTEALSCNSPPIVTTARQTGNSEFYTSDYFRLTDDNLKKLKLDGDSPKKYYFFDENDKLQVYQLVNPTVIENFYKMKQDFTLEEGLLVFLAAERFNDPAMAKLEGRTKEECFQIFTKSISNPAIFNALQNGFRKMDSNQMNKLMFSLPFTEHEDMMIKKIDEKQPPTHEELHKIQKEGFTHFRGRRAIASRYSQLWTNKELDGQIYENETLLKENTILPFHDKFSAATLKYLSGCSTPEMNDSLNFVKKVAAVSHLHTLTGTPILGNLTLYGKVHKVIGEKSFVYLSNGKLCFEPQTTRLVSYCNNICIKISNGKIAFFNAFGFAVVINGIILLSGQKVVFPHKDKFLVNIPNIDVFSYAAFPFSAPDTKARAKDFNQILTEKRESTIENQISEAISSEKVSGLNGVAEGGEKSEVNGITPFNSILPSTSKEKRRHDKNEQSTAETEPDVKRAFLDKEETANDIKTTAPVARENSSKGVKRDEVVEALRKFEYPADEFDSIPIPYDLRLKARMRSVDGLPTTRPSDDRLLPEFALYKYLTFDSSKSMAPCDYVALKRYLNDEMFEKMKLSKFVKQYSTNLSMVPMSDNVSGALDYNKKLRTLLPPMHVPPSKSESDIRFYSKNQDVIIEETQLEYYGQLRFNPPTLDEHTKKVNNIPPRTKSCLVYNDFKCEYDLLNSYTPGIPKYYPYFAPKPKLVRDALGRPVWINKPKPQPVKQDHLPSVPVKQNSQPSVPMKQNNQTSVSFKQNNSPSVPVRRNRLPSVPRQPAVSFKQLYSPAPFSLYSSPQYYSLPAPPRYPHDGINRLRYVPPSVSETRTVTSEDVNMDESSDTARSSSLHNTRSYKETIRHDYDIFEK